MEIKSFESGAEFQGGNKLHSHYRAQDLPLGQARHGIMVREGNSLQTQGGSHSEDLPRGPFPILTGNRINPQIDTLS